MPRFTAADGTNLYYTDDGAGTPILCLAGLTRNGMDFDFVAPHLAGVRLIRMDYRGRGRSDWPGPDTYTIPQEGQDALALLDHLGLEKTAVLGTSRGGLIAMGIAAMARDRLLGVCLNDVGPVIDPDGLAFIAEYIGQAPRQTTLADFAEARARAMTGFEGVPMSRWLDEAKRMFTETPDGLSLNYDARLAEAFAGAADQPLPDLWPLFDALDGLPVALIRGANSDLLSSETAAKMGRRRPDMLFADVPGRGHIPFLDEPEALDLLHRWIALL